jgi:hypothetical protein
VSLVEGKPDVTLAKLFRFTADSSDFLRTTAQLGADLAPWTKNFVDNPFVKTSKSPILAAAQGVITGMRLTTGFGTPETGEALGESTKLFDEALSVFIDAQPRADSWDGAAAEEYGRRDHDQKDRASLLHAGDDAMRGALIREAGQVGATRDTLDDWSRYLWDFGLATFAIGLLGPYGRAAQLALDAGAAATALGVTGNSMWNLVNDASDNAAKVREASDYYRQADHEVVKGLGCDPFGPERSKLPTRINPPIPNHVPAAGSNDEPQWPPATPYGESGMPAPNAPIPGPPTPGRSAPSAPAAVAQASMQFARAPATASVPAPWVVPPTTPAPAPAVASASVGPVSRGGPGPRLAPATSSAPVSATGTPSPSVGSTPTASPTLGAQPARTGERAPVTPHAPDSTGQTVREPAHAMTSGPRPPQRPAPRSHGCPTTT